jgi:dodecin
MFPNYYKIKFNNISTYLHRGTKEDKMTESVCRNITIFGTSSNSWRAASIIAIENAARTMKAFPGAEIAELNLHSEKIKDLSYRAKVKITYKIEKREEECIYEGPDWLNLKEHLFTDG